jgi:hypothetical protein
MDKDTWSYTILGNDKSTEIYGGFLNIVMASLTLEEQNNLDKVINNSECFKRKIEECYDILVSFAFKSESRLGFQALGAFLMWHGAIITDNVKQLILKYSKWEDEIKQLKNERDKNERKWALIDFREKIKNYNADYKVKVPDETITDVINKKKKNKDNSPIWRRAINHDIKDLKELNKDISEYFKINNLNFRVNDYITLRLECGKTFIYVNEKKFIICKQVLINISNEDLEESVHANSIDGFLTHLNDVPNHFQYESTSVPINVEFWVHCSNLQVWAENNYDTRLLHSNLSFPLLKRLTEVGDSIANKVFKREIIKRFESGHINVIEFLFEDDYLEFISKEDLQYLIRYLDVLINNTKSKEKQNKISKIKKEIEFCYF